MLIYSLKRLKFHEIVTMRKNRKGEQNARLFNKLQLST